MRAAHAIRGRTSKSQIKHRFRLCQRYLFTVIVNGLCKAENTAMVIDSRGFSAFPDRTYVKDYRWTLSGGLLDLVFLLFGVGLLLMERMH